MSIEAHVSQLNTKHRTLESLISEELRHPFPDTLRLSKLKREKLLIKDRISALAD